MFQIFPNNVKWGNARREEASLKFEQKHIQRAKPPLELQLEMSLDAKRLGSKESMDIITDRLAVKNGIMQAREKKARWMCQSGHRKSY